MTRLRERRFSDVIGWNSVVGLKQVALIHMRMLVSKDPLETRCNEEKLNPRLEILVDNNYLVGTRKRSNKFKHTCTFIREQAGKLQAKH